MQYFPLKNTIKSLCLLEQNLMSNSTNGSVLNLFKNREGETVSFIQLQRLLKNIAICEV